MGKLQPHTTATLIPSTPRLVLRGGLGWHQTEREKQEDCVTDFYPPSSTYVASYEEDVPNPVNNLVPEPTPRE